MTYWDFREFVTSPEAEGAVWHMDRTTEEVVTECECCRAEPRHTVDELAGTFMSTHKAGYVCAGGRTGATSDE